jgi:hypothetical protein
MANQFASIITASNGQQCLFYVEPDETDFLLHQVIQTEPEGDQIDIILHIKPDPGMDDEQFKLKAYQSIAKINQAYADQLLTSVEAMLSY